MRFITDLLVVSVGHGTQVQSLHTLSINSLLKILKKKSFKMPAAGTFLMNIYIQRIQRLHVLVEELGLQRQALTIGLLRGQELLMLYKLVLGSGRNKCRGQGNTVFSVRCWYLNRHSGEWPAGEASQEEALN